MYWLGEIGKIFRDFKIFKKKYENMVKIMLKKAIVKDFPPIFARVGEGWRILV